MTEKELEQMNQNSERETELKSLKPISFDDLEKKVKEWMLVADPGVIKFICGVYVANQMPRDPVWVFVIGPSGGGKTELLGGLLDLANIYPISLLTPNTFLSGMPGKGDCSLLPQVNGKTLIFKDWTSILSMNKDARMEIMAQFREIYDGHLKKPFGNGRVAEWKGKIGLIAGTTSMVDQAQQMHTTLGERFIHYRIVMPDRKEVARRSLRNGSKQDQMRKEIRDAFYAFFKGCDMTREVVSLPEHAQEEIVKVANLATMARSGVIRDFGMKKEVVFVPSSEMPTRITQQLNTLAQAFMIMNNGEFKESDMTIIYKVALDSVPQTNRMVMMEMARQNNQETASIATALGYPTSPIHTYLENLAMLGVCRRIRGKDSDEGGTADRWMLNEEFAHILQTYEHITPVDNDMPKPEEFSIVRKLEAEDREKAAKYKPVIIDPEILTPVEKEWGAFQDRYEQPKE